MKKYSRPVEGECGGGGVASVAQDRRGAQGEHEHEHRSHPDPGVDDHDSNISMMDITKMMVFTSQSSGERPGGVRGGATGRQRQGHPGKKFEKSLTSFSKLFFNEQPVTR